MNLRDNLIKYGYYLWRNFIQEHIIRSGIGPNLCKRLFALSKICGSDKPSYREWYDRQIFDCVWPAPRILTQWISFLTFHVMDGNPMDATKDHWYGIVHVNVDFIPLQKIYVISTLGSFVLITCFEQCELWIL